MNYIADKVKIWKFPRDISFESVPGYLNSFVPKSEYGKVVFDMKETETFHASFVGFLLHVKSVSERNGTAFDVLFSERAARTIRMMGLFSHFCISRSDERNELSA